MSYTKIPNLYKDQTILMFKECWALEKIHGTSAHVSWNEGKLGFFSGGEKYANFVKLFDNDCLTNAFNKMNATKIIIFGEAYGGKQQGMSSTYGKELKFIAFDVKVGDVWLNIPDAHGLVSGSLRLDFVHYQRTACNVSILDKLRDAGSVQSQRNGIEEFRKAEGIVIRPIVEMTTNSGRRICAKHKRDDYQERKTRQEVDGEKLKVLEAAQAIAEEWVTENRLNNILTHISKEHEISDIPDIVKRMIEDVQEEAKDEIVESKEARKAIGKLAVKLFKKKIMTIEPDSDKRAALDGGYQPVRPKNISTAYEPTGDDDD